MPRPLLRRSFIAAGTAALGAGVLGRAVRAAGRQQQASLVARRVPVTDVYFGERVVDEYRWMEDASDRDWLPFMRAHAAHARSSLDRYAGRPALLRRIAELSGDVTQVVGPRRAGPSVFFEKRAAGSSRYVLTARHADGTEHALVDPAQLGSATAPASLDWWMPSPHGRYVVFGSSTGGSENSIASIVDVETRAVGDDRLEHVPYAAPAWLPDESGFFYGRFAGKPSGDPAFYNDRSVWFHRVGTPQTSDVRIVARDADPAVALQPVSTPQLQTGIASPFVALLVSEGYVRTLSVYVAALSDAVAGKAAWRRICGADDRVVDATLSGNDLFLTRTSDDAPRGRVVRLAADRGTLADAVPLAISGDGVVDELNAAANGTFVTLNDGGEQRLVFAARDGVVSPVGLPFTGWIQSVAVSPDGSEAFVRVSGWLEPAAILTCDVAAKSAARTELQPLPNVALDPYESVRTYATAKDGTRVPISIVARKDSRAHGPAPALVFVYGAYQWPSQPVFDVRGIAFLEAGGILATAHVRGGGEYGEPWHRAGQKATKPNTWRDLIACCEQLIAEGYTKPGEVAILGGSAGGIAVGRAMTERPDLFGAVISKVGMSNPLRAEFEPNGPPNIPEFGTVRERDGFQALRAMDSFHAVANGVVYPPMLLTTGINDARVAPHNAAKMTARLLAASGRARVLLRVDFEGGHLSGGQSKERSDAEYADDYAFVLEHTRGPARPA